ncbi:hypothetical protein SUGI_0293000 [Cryptomeria japonica]|uniref:nuclear transport factor 2 n=1 Tax=Cryptomeria japonica TaxID=3369 RepID=UPI002408E54D|nr:nuclear transport factor 2 [Cryptomeria japonica]GLJ16954.1 hypothetical protein SUGI_0293000 [Cryptomeria japonica]
MESQKLHSKVPASEVANEFVRQYYSALKLCPNDLYMFYKDCSTITRPESNGQTIQVIKDKIVALYDEANEAKISTVDSHEAPNESYIILVTGVMLGHNKMERKFVQSFFLAPQETGHFILADLFRYLEEPQYSDQKIMLDNEISDKPLHEGKEVASSILDAQPCFIFPHVSSATELVPAQEVGEFESQHSTVEEEEGTKAELVPGQESQGSESKPSNLEKERATEDVQNEKLTAEGLIPGQELQGFESQLSKLEEVQATEPVQNEQLTVAELVHSLQGFEAQGSKLEEQGTKALQNEKQLKSGEKTISASEETAKRSFLSVLLKKNVHPLQAQNVVVKFAINTRQKGNVPSQVQTTVEAPVNENSIHIRNLPWDITTSLLEKEFEKFGSIKPSGIQIRSNKERGFCYGFIEFQTSTSMEIAIKASPIIISGRHVYVEKERPSRIRASTVQNPPSKENILNKLKRGGVGNGQSGYARSAPRNF